VKFVLLKTVLPGGTEFCLLLEIPDHINVEKEKDKWMTEGAALKEKEGSSPGYCLLEFAAYLQLRGGSMIPFQSCRVII